MLKEKRRTLLEYFYTTPNPNGEVFEDYNGRKYHAEILGDPASSSGLVILTFKDGKSKVALFSDHTEDLEVLANSNQVNL